jgi:hypothetical protein
MKILFRDFNVNYGKKDIFKLTIANECLHLESSIDGVSQKNKLCQIKESSF